MGICAPSLGFPDRIIFDLDPDDAVAWENLRQAALLVKTLLENIGLAPFLKTTGGKGLHVVVPILPGVGWEHVKGFTRPLRNSSSGHFPTVSRQAAENLASGQDLHRLSAEQRGDGGCGLFDRARQAPVSAPVTWNELSADLRFDHFNVGNMPKLKK